MQARSSRDGRGKYDRSSGKGGKAAWIPYVQRHMSAITSGNLSSFLAAGCAKGCPQHGKCMENMCTVRVLKVAATESFGDAALTMQWGELTAKHTAVEGWFQRAHAGRRTDAHGKVVGIIYKVDDQLVCHPAWTAMRGIPPATSSSIERAVRGGVQCLCSVSRYSACAWCVYVAYVRYMAGEMEWKDSTAKSAANATRALEGTLKAAATAWWTTRLGFYEMITARGIILHPRSVEWKTVYAQEFVPEMQLLGHLWKDPHAETDDLAYGSIATWYQGRTEALQALAIQKLGPGSVPFKFKSREKHSAYKECTDCQTLRLAVSEAIKRRAPSNEIHALKENYTSHLQWMLKQRASMDQMTQLAGHEGYIVENSDKCGDDCLYLPNSNRASSSNMSLYKYRLSLQANVYAGKLFHLTLLLPNLVTGADFGVTSFLSGLARMFQLGEVTPQKRRLMRGMDGGSENVNFVGLAMNSTIVKELHRGSINTVQQHRLVPDHSHHWLTDGTFSVIEGWLCHDGFPGCATIWDLIEYLRSKFATAANYKNKEVEITCLLVTFAFTKWFDGCINQDQVNRIGAPLVWRHQWSEEREEVVVHYKMALSDEALLEKDEWGPWVERLIEHNDPQTGRVEMIKVTPPPPRCSPPLAAATAAATLLPQPQQQHSHRHIPQPPHLCSCRRSRP